MLTERRHKRFTMFRFWAFEDDPAGGDDGGAEGSDQISTQATSTSASVDMATQSEISDSVVDWNAIIPADLQEKPYFQQILKAEDPGKELITQFDNAQKLIGSRPAGVPKEDATEEDWNKFYETTRPEKAEDYEFNMPEFDEKDADIKTFFESQGINEELQNSFKASAHKYGLTKKQAAGFLSEVEGQFLGKLTGMVRAQKEVDAGLDVQFNQITNESFGGDKDKAIEAGKQFIDKLAPPELKKYMTGLSNEALVIIAGMGVTHAKKYEGTDTMAPRGGTTETGDIEGTRTRMHELMKSDAYNQPLHADNEKTLQEVWALSAQLTALEKKAVKR